MPMQRSQIATSFLPLPGSPPVEWRIEPGLDRLCGCARHSWRRAPPRSATATAAEMVWLVEHPPLYTAGTSAAAEDLVEPDRFPVFAPGAAANTPITAPASASPM